MDCSLPGSSVHVISQARILKWVAISSSGHLPDPRVCIGRWILYHEPPGKPSSALSSRIKTQNCSKPKLLKPGWAALFAVLVYQLLHHQPQLHLLQTYFLLSDCRHKAFTDPRPESKSSLFNFLCWTTLQSLTYFTYSCSVRGSWICVSSQELSRCIQQSSFPIVSTNTVEYVIYIWLSIIIDYSFITITSMTIMTNIYLILSCVRHHSIALPV